MSKIATKASDNDFYKARIAASSCNDRLASREGAAEETGIDRTRLARIELGSLNPYPEEVLLMMDTWTMRFWLLVTSDDIGAKGFRKPALRRF